MRFTSRLILCAVVPAGLFVLALAISLWGLTRTQSDFSRYCSVPFCLELNRLLARMTFCRMSRALLVQMNGLGLVL